MSGINQIIQLWFNIYSHNYPHKNTQNKQFTTIVKVYLLNNQS